MMACGIPIGSSSAVPEYQTQARIRELHEQFLGDGVLQELPPEKRGRKSHPRDFVVTILADAQWDSDTHMSPVNSGFGSPPGKAQND